MKDHNQDYLLEIFCGALFVASLGVAIFVAWATV